jgi:hypothetical protein
MSSITRTPTAPSTPARDQGNHAALALLRRAGEQAALLRHSKAAYQDETPVDAARTREIVAADLFRAHWRRPATYEFTPARRRHLLKLQARRRELANA